MTRPEDVLCGVAAHEQVTAERDALRAILRDLLEERGIVSHDEAVQLFRVRALLRADGCWDCATPLSAHPLGRRRAQHHHHPSDRASSYRLLLGPIESDPPTASAATASAAGGALLRVLDRLLVGR